ncbi:MAG: helix-turn-helix transcriptional regulator [Candidatus Thorarchaeota archaeon]|nr:MAG: helix-turn-helix transcriptional regulator [Candidatus Thorarchaeota archaeon]
MSATKSSPPEQLAPTYISVLSLIGRGARYGYEIDKILDEHGYRNWVEIKMSSVYKALSKLEEWGLIASKEGTGSLGPSRKVYSLTRRGKQTLETELVRLLSDPPRRFSQFDLGLSGSSLLTKSQVVSAIQAYIGRLDERIRFLHGNVEVFERIESATDTEGQAESGSRRRPEFEDQDNFGVVIALFERPLTVLRCEREWLSSLLRSIKEERRKYSFSKKKGDSKNERLEEGV